MKAAQRKPRLSGAQRRKILRQQTVPAAHDGEVLKRIRVGQLDTVDQWRREIGKIYREMRFNTIRTEIGTRLVYVAEIGARLAKMQQELTELESLRQQLAQLQNGTLPLHNSIDFIPAQSESTGDDE